jgi:hypothetical protein
MRLSGAFLLLALALTADCQRKPGEKKMTQVRLLEALRGTALSPAIAPIQPGPALPAPAPAKPDGKGYVSFFANPAANSRSSFGLPQGPLAPRWSVALPDSANPRSILQDRDRIVLFGRRWLLLDIQGRTIAAGYGEGGPIGLDMAHGLFYRLAAGASMAAVRTADGVQRFTYPTSHGDRYSWSLLARRGDRVLIGGNQLDIKPRDSGPPQSLSSVVDRVELPEPLHIDDMGGVETDIPDKRLYFSSHEVLFAGTDQVLAAASPGRVFIVDWDLKVSRALEASFAPVGMSLDEAGRIYLVVKREGKPDALWAIAPEGALLYSFEFPMGTGKLIAPPIVAWDHRVYLLSDRQIVSLGVDGKSNWIRSTEGAVAGAVVLPDGRLLVAEGPAIAAWDADGKRTVVYNTGGDAFRTPPVPTAAGAVLAATATHLHCLAPKSAPRP